MKTVSHDIYYENVNIAERINSSSYFVRNDTALYLFNVSGCFSLSLTRIAFIN